MSKFLPIGERLREERERLGYSQEKFSSIGGASRKSQYNYEAGERPPDAGYLSAIASVGADVAYILTGYRNALRPDQVALLNNVEHCSKEDQDAIKRMALLASWATDRDAAESIKKKKA